MKIDQIIHYSTDILAFYDFIKNYNCTMDFAKDLLKYQSNMHKNKYKYLNSIY